ncbi:MAG: hypothetical protein M3O61_11895 [Gemmatimonadota bacterium]|nr:hypothetical protein [Gemmatimonadota bacterium]
MLDVPRLLRHGRATREQIVAFQERRLRELVHHAYERVPYYRRLFDEARIKPADIRTLADLRIIPITTKETLRALPRDELLARGVNRSRLIKHESNGSTGIPVTVFRHRSETIALAAVHRRARSEVRIGRGHHVAIVNWRNRGGSSAPRKRSGSLMHKLWGVESTTQINCVLPVEEISKFQSVGEPGEVVGTSLTYAAMPFIRYELGDVVTRGPDRCACGSPFSTLSAIQGRVVDYFPLPDGRVIHPYDISAIIWETAFRYMRQYQLVQERSDRIVAHIALVSEEYRREVLAAMRRVEDLLGPQVQLVLHFVQEIPPGARGKFGIYRSLVRSEYA